MKMDKTILLIAKDKELTKLFCEAFLWVGYPQMVHAKIEKLKKRTAEKYNITVETYTYR